MKQHLISKLRELPAIGFDPPQWQRFISDKSRVVETLTPAFDALMHSLGLRFWVTREYELVRAEGSRQEAAQGLERTFRVIFQQDVPLPPDLAQRVAALPGIEEARLIAAVETPLPIPQLSLPASIAQKAGDLIHLPYAHALTRGDPQITIAVLDTGVDSSQRLALEPARQGVSYIPESALVINAFGDHFLTDAFSAGHVINKAEAMELFYANFYTGNTLSPAGEAFFGKVAAKAFHGKLARKFSTLETYDPVFLWWNPNIDTENAFRKLLIKIANDQDSGKAGVANLAVKALHDKLNREGYMVTNGRHAQPWQLYGDGNLSKHPSGTTLRIMREAVAQSVANILDPAILRSNLDPVPFFDRVWAYVPQLTPSSQASLVRMMPTYLHPGSGELAQAAADILHLEVETLIDELIARKKLKPA